MKVKLKYDYIFVEEEGCSPIAFYEDEVYEVLYTLNDERFGLYDHTVYVIINEELDVLSLSAEVCTVVE